MVEEIIVKNSIFVAAFLMGLCGSLSEAQVSPTPASTMAPPKDFGLILNGGYDKGNNHQRYLENVKSVYGAYRNLGLDAGDITVLYGSGSFADGTTAETGTGGVGKTVKKAIGLKSAPIQSDEYVFGAKDSKKIDGKASYENLKKKIEDVKSKMKPGDSLNLFITDHGSTKKNPSGGKNESKVVLWGEEITVSQMGELLKLIPESNQVHIVTNICYGGGLTELTSNNVCVFANQVPSKTSLSESEELDLYGQNFGKALSEKKDFDGDGKATLWDAHQYAKSKDNPGNQGYTSMDWFLDKNAKVILAAEKEYIDKNGTSELGSKEDPKDGSGQRRLERSICPRDVEKPGGKQISSINTLFKDFEMYMSCTNLDGVLPEDQALLNGRLRKLVDEYQKSEMWKTQAELDTQTKAFADELNAKADQWDKMKPEEQKLQFDKATVKADQKRTAIQNLKEKSNKYQDNRMEVRALKYGPDAVRQQYRKMRSCMDHEISAK